MLLALALYASTAHAGVVANENTPHDDLELLYHDGKAHRSDKCLLLRLPPSPRLRCVLACAAKSLGPASGRILTSTK